jgi:hypothetical protein
MAFIADLNHYTKDGKINPNSAPGVKKMAKYLLSIFNYSKINGIRAASDIKCLKRPKRKPCTGKLIIQRKSDNEVVWECPVCGDFGVIKS